MKSLSGKRMKAVPGCEIGGHEAEDRVVDRKAAIRSRSCCGYCFLRSLSACIGCLRMITGPLGYPAGSKSLVFTFTSM